MRLADTLEVINRDSGSKRNAYFVKYENRIQIFALTQISKCCTQCPSSTRSDANHKHL